jgi:hypothetical protein
MARPHICFIQAQSLRWSEARDGGAAAKTLSVDANDGSRTALLRLPAGHSGTLRGAGDGYAEWLILDGAANIDGIAYQRHGYGYVPRNGGALAISTSGRAADARAQHRTAPNGAAGESGAVLLLMTGPAPAHDASAVSLPGTFALPWRFGADGSVTGKPLGAGIASKPLRRDPITLEQSFLYCAMPQHPPPAIMVGKFTHPVIEEIFVLDGSYVFGDVGRMGPGAYCFWREGEWHGPAGSETGYHLFIRVIGGPLSNQFSNEPAPFSWRPPYRPALPEGMRSGASEYLAGERW